MDDCCMVIDAANTHQVTVHSRLQDRACVHCQLDSETPVQVW